MRMEQVRKNIAENELAGFRKTIISEITRCKGATARLDAVIDDAIISSVNRIANSKNLDRLNVLVESLCSTKMTAKVNAIAKNFAAYAGFENCLAFNAKHKAFVCTDYGALSAVCQNYKIPAVRFSDWLKDHKPTKTEKILKETEAIKKLTDILLAMRKSPQCQSTKLAGIMAALHEFCTQNAEDYVAALELEKIVN